ncbi:MAG: radical SAM protein [Sedimentisphaerales bacterium]|nr:radical SAM protein [Sedimentisphaerales bacterium]
MRATLAFAPCAGPTYMPLGIASLSAFIKANNPECQLNVADLNIAAWHWLIDQKKEYQDFRNFMQGRLGSFFDEARYRMHQRAWNRLVEIHNNYIVMARFYLEQNSLSADFQKLLEYFSGLVLANDPELIGFSVMYPRQVLISLALAKFLHFKCTPRVKPVIVFGGAMMPAMYGEEILQACPFVDAVFEGEGEPGLEMLCEGRDFAGIHGFIHRGQAGIIRNKKVDTITMAKLPLPDFTEWNFSSYFNPEPVVPVVFSRGCKWRKCRFCAHNFSYSGYRRRNTERFVDYLCRLNGQTGARHFYFADQYIEAADMKILAEEILRRDLHIYFHIMGRPMDDYTPEILQLLFKAGCRWISWGIESGSQRLLDVCLKGTSVETVRKVVRDSHQAGISNLLMLIFGLPTSGEEDFNATLDMLDDLDDAVDDVKSSCFQLFDKTAFAAQAKAFGLQVTGREVLFSNEYGMVHSHRLFYKEKSVDGTMRPPRGLLEITQRQRRKLWNCHDSILQSLCCEHYLLYVAHRSDIRPDMLAANS